MQIVAIDSKSHQAVRHWGTEGSIYEQCEHVGGWKDERLSGLVDDLQRDAYGLRSIAITEESLQDVSVLIISGRTNWLPFSDDELVAIRSFWSRGGGLFLMASHEGFVEPQNQVAQVLGLPGTFHETWVNNPDPQVESKSEHPILRNVDGNTRIRTCCNMSLESDVPVALVSDTNSEIGSIVAAIESMAPDCGRVVVSTSSGHIASRDDSGADLYGAGSNAELTLGIIEWLAGG